MPVRTRSPLRGAILLAALASPACNLAVDEARREIPGGYLLMQKGDFQALHTTKAASCACCRTATTTAEPRS